KHSRAGGYSRRVVRWLSAAAQAVARAPGRLARWLARTARAAARAVWSGLARVGRAAILALQILRVLPRPRLYFTSAMQQAYVMGIASLPLVLFMASLGGAVTSQQTGAQFSGGLPLWVVGSVLAASMLTELGPLLTGIVMMARIGAAI